MGEVVPLSQGQSPDALKDQRPDEKSVAGALLDNDPLVFWTPVGVDGGASTERAPGLLPHAPSSRRLLDKLDCASLGGLAAVDILERPELELPCAAPEMEDLAVLGEPPVFDGFRTDRAGG